MVRSAWVVLIGLSLCVGCESSGRRAPVTESSVGWRNLRVGTPHTRVLTELGEPTASETRRLQTTWYYSERGEDGPWVRFDTNSMTLELWSTRTE